MIVIYRCGQERWRQAVRSVHWNVQDVVEKDVGGE